MRHRHDPANLRNGAETTSRDRGQATIFTTLLVSGPVDASIVAFESGQAAVSSKTIQTLLSEPGVVRAVLGATCTSPSLAPRHRPRMPLRSTGAPWPPLWASYLSFEPHPVPTVGLARRARQLHASQRRQAIIVADQADASVDLDHGSGSGFLPLHARRALPSPSSNVAFAKCVSLFLTGSG
jgi:hypothetical protein